jgi:hypothetical protein
MDLRVKAWQLPPRLITGAYFLNAGLSKRDADDATAGQLHGFAAGTYPLLGKLDAKRFTSLLSTAEIAIGAALVVPMVPAWLAGTGADRLRPGHPRPVPEDPRHARRGFAAAHPGGHPPGQGRLDGWHRTRPHGRRGR